MTATPFTRREALSNGVLGVASLTIAERLLAYGGQNEALAAMKPTLAKKGYGPPVFKKGQPLALPKGFRVRPLRPRRVDDVRRPADAHLPRRHRLLQGPPGHGLDRPQPGGLPAGPRPGTGQRLRPDRPGRRHRLPLQHQDRKGPRQRARPQRHRQQLQRRRDAVGHLAERRGEHGRQGAGLRRRARLCVRGPRARQLDHRAAPDQGDGALRPRGLPGRPEDGDRLHDRGQRRPRRRLLPLPAPPQGQAASRRQAADARHPRPAEVQHRHSIRRWARSSSAAGSTSRTRTPTAPTASRRRSTCRAATRAARSSSGLEGGTFSKGSCYFTASDGGDTGQGQIWKYTPDNKNFKRGTLQLVYESHFHRVLAGPDAITQSPRGGILVCEDGASEDVKGQPSRFKYISPNGKLNDFGVVTEPMQLHDNIAADLFPYNPDRWDHPPEKGEGVGPQRGRGRRLQPGRQVAVPPHPVSGRDVRDHRALAQGLAVRRAE